MRRLAASQKLLQVAALGRQMHKPPAAVTVIGFLHDIAFIDQGRQHTVEGLLGDLQDRQQFRHADARVGADEIDRPVMGAAHVVIGQDGVGFAREVTVGEEQQFHGVAQVVIARRQGIGLLLDPGDLFIHDGFLHRGRRKIWSKTPQK